MFATAAAAVLAPVGGFAHTAAPSAPSTGHRVFRVMVEDFLQVTLRCPDVATALREAESYRQEGDHLSLWEDSKLVGYITERGPVQIAPDAPAPAPAYTGRWDHAGRKFAVMYVPKGKAPFDAPNCVPCEDGPGYFIMVDLTPSGGPRRDKAAVVESEDFKVGGYPLRVVMRLDGTDGQGEDHLFDVPSRSGLFKFSVYHAPSPERKAALAKWHAGDHSIEVIDDLIRL